MYPTGPASVRQLARRVRKLAVDVPFAASVTPKPNQYDVLNVGVLTGPITIANPAGSFTDGQEFTLRLTQDATGRVVTFGANYAFSTQVPEPSVLETANAKTEITFRYNKG